MVCWVTLMKEVNLGNEDGLIDLQQLKRICIFKFYKGIVTCGVNNSQ